MEEQQQQGNQSLPYYQPTIIPSEKSDLFDKIRPEEVVETIRNKLMGKEYNMVTGEWYIPKWKTKGLSELGAAQIASLMLAVSSKNVAISKLNDSEIRQRTRAIHATAMKMCISNWKEYGIENPDQIWLVSEIVTSNTFITLKQPENAGIRELIKGTTQESRVVNDTPQKGGIMSAIFRR